MSFRVCDPRDLDITVISAKHLKNVNWRGGGDLKPYVVVYLDPDIRLSTRPDRSIKPVWNERISLPVTRHLHESVLTVEIFHSQPSDSDPPLVGSVRFPLAHLVDSADSFHSLELIRPSGRPQGKIRLRLEIKERPCPPPLIHAPPQPQPQTQDYYNTPKSRFYYSSAPPPPSPYLSFGDPYYPGYYYPRPSPPPPSSNYSLPPVTTPSAPVDHRTPYDRALAAADFDHKPPAPAPALPVATGGARLSNQGVPSGSGMPSAPVDYSAYDHHHRQVQVQVQKEMAGLSLEEERVSPADRTAVESDFASTRMSYGYGGGAGGDYRREC